KSYAPPGSFTGTPSTRTLTYLLSPPRRNSDVAPPKDPTCAKVIPGMVRSASAIDVTPRRRSSSPVTTLVVAGDDADAIGTRVAVTTIGASRVVSGGDCCAPRESAIIVETAAAVGRTGRGIDGARG